MDWATIIGALGGAMLGGGGIGSFFYIREKKRQMNAETEASVSKEWRELAERKMEIIDKKDAYIEQLHDENKQLRRRNDVLSSEVARLMVLRCTKIKCIDRKPPFGATEITFDYGNIEGIAKQ